jgi:hypothetical protein
MSRNINSPKAKATPNTNPFRLSKFINYILNISNLAFGTTTIIAE